jgi:hypothetical protein
MKLFAKTTGGGSGDPARYFEIACRRVDEAARQPDLLIPENLQAPQQKAMQL